MFDIKYLFIPEIKNIFDEISDYGDKVEFLFKLLDFEIYFKKYADKISQHWINETQERYSSEDYAFMINEKPFVMEYALKTQNTEKIFDLINKLCNPDVYDYDNVIADAENDTAVIANIDDFEFTDDKTSEAAEKPIRRTSLDVLLKFEPKN